MPYVTGTVHLVPSLSLEPEFSRCDSNLDKAFGEGQVDEEALENAAGHHCLDRARIIP